MDIKKIIMVVSGIVVFGYSAIWGIGSDKLDYFIDTASFLYVFGGGCALACAKIPRSVNDFLRYSSRTFLWCGSLGTLTGGINMLKGMGLGYGYDPSTTLALDLSVTLITMFYGVLFSAIAYALYQESWDCEKGIAKKEKE